MARLRLTAERITAAGLNSYRRCVISGVRSIRTVIYLYIGPSHIHIYLYEYGHRAEEALFRGRGKRESRAAARETPFRNYPRSLRESPRESLLQRRGARILYIAAVYPQILPGQTSYGLD